MLTVLGGRDRNCAGMTRRRMLQAGGAGLFGLNLPKLLAAEAVGSQRRARAKSVIFLYLFGGPSQLETFDMKPDAPSTLRGPFQPIASRTPDLRICEHLPKLAAASDKFCVVRTMSHAYNDHSGGGHYIQTGHRWHIPIGGGFNATSKDWPSMGSVVEYDAQRRNDSAGDVPNYAFLPKPLGHIQKFATKLERPGQYGGWLGRGYDPLATDFQKRDENDEPYFRDCTDDELDFSIGGLGVPPGLTLDRLDGRQSLLAQFDAGRRALDGSQSVEAYNGFRRRALALVSSSKTRDALNVRLEPAATRDRYGRHLFGQSTLVARRLVEAGTRFVTVAWDTAFGLGWDSHGSASDQRNYLLPGLDQAASALLTDLDDRGLLDETLVVCCGEMGRTPKRSNDKWGRGHWSYLFPALVAGAGVRGGTLYGRSDKDAAYAETSPTSPEDLAATIYTALGIDPEMRLIDPLGRPVSLIEGGRPLPIFG
jgi:hypothetical protein